jgi:acetolactate decarboxylase
MLVMNTVMMYVRKIVLLIFLFLLLCMPVHAKIDTSVIFQYSTLNALQAGVYEGEISLSELKKHGDFGVGTFDGLDGEMILLNGEWYQIKSDGRVYIPGKNAKTPFAQVTWFLPEQKIGLKNAEGIDAVCRKMDESLSTKNLFYAVKIKGLFKSVKLRSVPKQSAPYPALSEAVKSQTVFEAKDVEGSIIGYRYPDYISEINISGYHLHFISSDRTLGGHLLDCSVDNAAASIDQKRGLFLLLSETDEFKRTDLSKPQNDSLIKSEK